MRVLVAIAALLGVSCARSGSPEALVCPAVAPYVVVREVAKEAPPRECELLDRSVRTNEAVVDAVETAIFAWEVVNRHRGASRTGIVCLAVPCNEAVSTTVLYGLQRDDLIVRDVVQCETHGVDGARDRQLDRPALKFRITQLEFMTDDRCWARITVVGVSGSAAGEVMQLRRTPEGWIVEGVQTEWVS